MYFMYFIAKMYHIWTALGSFAKLRKAVTSFVTSVCLSVRLIAWNNWAPTGRFFIEFDVWEVFENVKWQFKFIKNLTRITGNLHGDRQPFKIPSRWNLLRMWNVSDKSCRENQNKLFMINNAFSENRTLYEIKWEDTVELDRLPMTTEHDACAMHDVYVRLHTHTHARTFRICNSCCLYTATIFTRTRLNFYVVLTFPVLLNTCVIPWSISWG
jgi:hypothetical protein